MRFTVINRLHRDHVEKQKSRVDAQVGLCWERLDLACIYLALSHQLKGVTRLSTRVSKGIIERTSAQRHS